MIILRVVKNSSKGFTLSLETHFWKNHKGVKLGAVFLGLSHLGLWVTWSCETKTIISPLSQCLQPSRRQDYELP